MITAENYCEPFERFPPKQVVLLSEVRGVETAWNKSWQSGRWAFYVSFSRWRSKAKAKLKLKGICWCFPQSEQPSIHLYRLIVKKKGLDFSPYERIIHIFEYISSWIMRQSW